MPTETKAANSSRLAHPYLVRLSAFILTALHIASRPRAAADEGPADEQDPFLLVRNVTLMHHIVCENRATNVGILRQSHREDTWRPLAQPAGRHCQRRTDKNYLRDVSREALGQGDVNAKGRVEAIMVRAGCLSPYRASMIVR